MSTDWDEIGYVISATYRVEVLRRVADSSPPSSRIAEDVDCAAAHVSRALTDLSERELVDLLLSESRQKGRNYGITVQRRETWEMIEAQNVPWRSRRWPSLVGHRKQRLGAALVCRRRDELGDTLPGAVCEPVHPTP